ncbi:MAG: hypothetical protein FJX47_12705 [Alphaproteobacteria bacterium]|nr:hypothetical protein [Alphaproteobacteria bacterium]
MGLSHSPEPRQRLQVASTDKFLHAIDLATGKSARAPIALGAKAFVAPVPLAGGTRLRLGTASGRLMDIDTTTGRITAQIQLSDRVMTTSVPIPGSDLWLVQTGDNRVTGLRAGAEGMTGSKGDTPS